MFYPVLKCQNKNNGIERILSVACPHNNFMHSLQQFTRNLVSHFNRSSESAGGRKIRHNLKNLHVKASYE